MAGLGQGIKTELAGQRFGHLLVLERGTPVLTGTHRYERWKCRCDCENIVLVTGKQLKRGQRSCGCHVFNGQFRKHKTDEDVNISKIVYHYKRGATARNYEWALTLDQAKSLLLSSCGYCGGPPSRVFRAYPDTSTTTVGGIDRIDNLQGYIPSNVLPCCKVCNRAKLDAPFDEFLQWLHRVRDTVDIPPFVNREMPVQPGCNQGILGG